MKLPRYFCLFYLFVGFANADSILFLGDSLSVLPNEHHFGGHVYRQLNSQFQTKEQTSYSRSGWNTAHYLEGSPRTTRRRNLLLTKGSIPNLRLLLSAHQPDWTIVQLGTNMYYYLVYFGEEKLRQMLQDFTSVLGNESHCVWILPPHIGEGHQKEITTGQGVKVQVSYNAYQYYVEKVMAEFLSSKCYLFDSLDLEGFVNGNSLEDFIHYHKEPLDASGTRMEIVWGEQFLRDFEVIRARGMSVSEYNERLLLRISARFEQKKNLKPYYRYAEKDYDFERLLPLNQL